MDASKRTWLAMLTVAWLAAVGFGMALLLHYACTPGGLARLSPATWPQSSAIKPAAGRAMLLMFAHPKCPCTRASVRELAQFMARQQNQVAAIVVLTVPAGAMEDWARTDLYRSAQAIPGVTVRLDREAGEAERFGAATSGHVVLYDSSGRLLFSGGITGARGHEGDNAGFLALGKLISGETPGPVATPVYGCPLGPAKLCKK